MKKLIIFIALATMIACNAVEKEETTTTTEVTSEKIGYIKITYVEQYNNSPAPAIQYVTSTREIIYFSSTKERDSVFIANIPVVDSVYSDEYSCYVKRITRHHYDKYIPDTY